MEITYLSNPDAQVEISIIDLNGKVVQKVCNCQTDAKGMLKRKIDARDFSPGSYLIKVNENGRIVTGKLVKWE
ncbi:MAG: T9SS type A sorting domain-containing protein [Bacteroidetes bacterium]|nr:T9SS type A sorting domain-containing protein [Bacteroidota bacterium]